MFVPVKFRLQLRDNNIALGSLEGLIKTFMTAGRIEKDKQKMHNLEVDGLIMEEGVDFVKGKDL